MVAVEGVVMMVTVVLSLIFAGDMVFVVMVLMLLLLLRMMMAEAIGYRWQLKPYNKNTIILRITQKGK